MAWEEITFKISADMDFGNALSQVNAVKEGVNSLKQSFVDMPNFTGILDSSLEKTTTVADALGSKLEKLQGKELSAKERNRTEKSAESNIEELNVLRQLQGGDSSYSLSMAHSFLSGLPAAMRNEFDAITPQISALIRSRMSTFSKELQFKSTSASGMAAEIMTAASRGKDKELSSLIKQGIHSSEGLYQFQDYLEYLIPHVVPQNRLSSYQMKRYGKTLSNSAGAFDRGEPIDLFPESYKTSYKSEGYRSSRLTKEQKVQALSSDYRSMLDDILKQNPVAVKAALSSGISRRDNRGILETKEEITREQWESFRAALYDELVTRASGYAASKINPYSNIKKDKETIAERFTQSTSGKAMMAMHAIEAMQDKNAWTDATGNLYYRKNHKEAKRLLDQYVVDKYSPFSIDPNFEKPSQVMISESQATRILGNGRYKNNDDISGDVVIVSMAGYDKANPEHIARRDKIDKEGLTVNGKKYVLDSIHGKDDDTIYRMISEQAKDDANRRQESWAREAGFSGTYFGNFADKQVEALRASGKLDETTYGKYAESKNKKWTPSYDVGVNPDNIRIAVVNMKGKDGVEYGDGGLWVSNMLMRDSSQSRIGVGGKGSNFVFTGENVGKAFEKWGTLDSQGRAMVNAPGGEQYDASDATILLPISVLKNKLAYQNEDGTWKSAEEINRMVTAEAKNLGLSAVVNYDTEDTRSDHLGAQTTSFLNFSPGVRQHQIELAMKRMRELDTEEGQLKYVFGNNEDWFDEKVNNDHSLLGTVQARRRIDNYRQKLMQSLVAGQFIDFGEGDDKFADIRAAANPLSSYLLSHYGGVTPEVIEKARGYLKKQGINDQYTDEDIENLINLKHGTAIDFAHEDKENLTLLRSPMGYGNILPVKNLAKKARPLYEAFGISTTAGAYASEEDRDVLQGFDYDADQFKVVLDQALAKEIEEISKKQEYKKRELETKSSDKIITDLSEGNKGITERKIEQGLGMGTGSAGTRAMQIDLTDPKNRGYIVGAQEMQYLYDKASTNDKNPQLVDLNGSRVWDVLKLGKEYTKFADHANELFKYDEDQLDENGLPDEGQLKKLDLYKASNGQIVNLRALRRMGIDDINAPSVNMASHMMSVGFANRLFREGLSDTTRWDAISEAMDQLDYGNAGVARKNLMQTMRHMLPEWASGRRARLTSEEDNALEKLIDAAIVELKNEAEEQKETAFNKDTGKWELGNSSYKTAQQFVNAYVENNKKLYGIRTAENLRTQFGLTGQRGEQYLGDYFDQSFINSGTRDLVGDIEATRKAQREEMVRQLEALEKEEAENAKQDIASQNNIKKDKNKGKQKHENKPRFGPGASNTDNTPLAGQSKQDVVPNEKAASMTSEPQNEIDLLKKRIADFDNETKHRVDFQAKYNQTLSEAREASNQLLISRLGNENKINGNTSYAKSYWNRQFYGIAKPQLDLLEEMGAEIGADSSFTTDEKSSFRAAIKQQQTEIQRNVNKDFVAKAIAYSQQVAEEINEEVEKTDKKPSAQKNKLNALDEKINNSKSFEDFIVKRMNDKNSIFNQEEQELFGSGLKNIRNNLANQLRERERLVDLYTKENEENALISMESLEGKLGKRDKNSLAVKYEDRLRSIQDQQEKFDKQHNERLMSDNFYNQQTEKLNAYKDSALEDLIKEERLKLGIDKASPKEIADKWYQDRIETINASKQLRVDTAKKAWMNGTGTYDDYVEAQKALYFGPNEEEKRLLAQRDNIEKSIEQKDSEERYRSITEANRLADVVEQANGIERFTKSISDEKTKKNIPITQTSPAIDKVSEIVNQVQTAAQTTQKESEKAIQTVFDAVKQTEPTVNKEQLEKEHAARKEDLQARKIAEEEQYAKDIQNIDKQKEIENQNYLAKKEALQTPKIEEKQTLQPLNQEYTTKQKEENLDQTLPMQQSTIQTNEDEMFNRAKSAIKPLLESQYGQDSHPVKLLEGIKNKEEFINNLNDPYSDMYKIRKVMTANNRAGLKYAEDKEAGQYAIDMLDEAYRIEAEKSIAKYYSNKDKKEVTEADLKNDQQELDKEHEAALEKIENQRQIIDKKHATAQEGFKQEEAALTQQGIDINSKLEEKSRETTKAIENAIEEIKVDKPKTDGSIVSDAAKDVTEETTKNIAENIKNTSSNVKLITKQEAQEASKNNFTDEEYKAATRNYEASAKTAQVAQGVRDQIAYLGGLKNRNAYEEATYQRLLAINPEDHPEYYNNLQNQFSAQIQAQEQYKEKTQLDSIAAIRENGQLALARQEASYRQYHDQRNMRMARSRAASFYMQDYNRHQQLGLQKQGLENSINQRQREIDRLQGLANSSTGKDKENYQNQIAQKTENLTQLKDQLKSVNKEYNDFNEKTAAGDAAISAFGQSVGMVARRFATQTFRKILNETKQFVKQFDKAMTEIQMITLKSDTQIDQLGSKLIDVAKSTGSTVTDVTSAASNLYRQGLSDEEVDERLDDVIKFSKVSGIKTTEASKIITTALQNGLVGNSTEAMDALVALGDSAATTASEIAKGMQKSAAAAKQSGMSYGELVTLLTIGTSKTQLGGSTIGSSLNTLMYRLYKVNNGEDFYDENGNHVSATSASKALSNMGISLYDENGKFRGPYQILQDIASNWENADDTTQSMILTTLGAGRQRSNIATLLQGMAEDNGEIAQKYLDTAEGSKGITDRKYEEYLDSLEAKTNTLKSSWDELINGFAGGDIAKGGLDFITTLVQGFTTFNELLGGAPGLIMGIVAAMGILAAVTTALGANPVFMAALPFIGAIAGLAGAVTGIGALANYISGSEKRRKEEQAKYVEKTKTETSNYVDSRNAKVQEYESHLSAMESLINDRRNNPDQWTDEKSKEFNMHFEALSNSMLDVTSASGDAASSIESMSAAARSASGAIQKYKTHTYEQALIMLQTVFDDIREKTKERNEEISKEYQGIIDLTESGTRYEQQKNVSNAASRFIEENKNDIIKSGMFAVSEKAPPLLKAAIEDLNTTGKVNARQDGSFSISAGKTFKSQQEFMDWLLTEEAQQKYGVSYKKGNASNALAAGDQGKADLFSGMTTGTYDKTYVPFLTSLFKTPGVIEQFNDPYLSAALDAVYHGSVDEFEADAKNKFAKLYAYQGKEGTQTYAGTFALSKLIQLGDAALSGEITDENGIPIISSILKTIEEKTNISNRTGWEQQLSTIQETGYYTGLSEAEENAIINWLVNNGYDSSAANSTDIFGRAIAAYNANKAKFVSDNADEEYLPIKWQGKKFESVEKALEYQFSREIRDGTYDPNSSGVRAVKASIQQANGITSGSAIEKGLATYEAARDNKARLASEVYEQFSSTEYEGGIHNLKELFNAVDKAQVDNFTELLQTFPELAKMLKDFVEYNEDTGTYKVKDEVAEDSALYKLFMSIIAGASDEHNRETPFISNAEKTRLSSLYYEGIDTTEQGYKNFADVIGSTNLASKYTAAQRSQAEAIERFKANEDYEMMKDKWLQAEENSGKTEEDYIKERGPQITEYGITSLETGYIEAKQRAYANGRTTLYDEDRLALLQQVQSHLGSSTENIDYEWFDSIDPDTLAQVTNGYTDLIDTIRNPDSNPEDIEKVWEDFNAQFASDKVSTLMKYKNTLDDIPDILKQIAKGGFDASKGYMQLRSQMNKLQDQTTALRNIQTEDGKWKSGKQIKNGKNGPKFLEILGEMIGRSADELENYSAEDMQKAFGGAQDRINEIYGNTIQGMLQEAADVAQSEHPDVKIDLADFAAVVNGEMDLSDIRGKIGDQAAKILEEVLALQGVYGKGTVVVDQEGRTFVVSAQMDAASNLHNKGGGGGGGGKSAVDKLLEEQKRRLASLEHESKMLSIEEKEYDYSNDYSGWRDNIQDQISLQEQLREAYKQNIQELENMLAKTKEGSDDWYKLKDAIYAAEEALAEVSNTINDLNLKNISILSDEMEDADKFSNHVINMLDKRAQQALSEDRFQNYEQLTERKIQETKDQRSQNNMEILRWKDYAQDKLNKGEITVGDDAWNEILNKIWELDEENAELDKSITEMELELNEQRLSQIAKVTQENLQTAAHNNNLASMYGNVYESLGYRKNYETMITEQMSNNEKLIAENTKAKEAVKEEMATLVEGSTAWFNAQAALYQYDEALAQTNISQMELNHTLEESKMQGIAETYEDWTRDLTHVNDLLSEEIDLFKETGDTKAQKKALQMYISNEDEMIAAKKQSLADLNKQLAEGLAAGTLDPAMQRALLDEINATETDILKMENDKLRKQREIDKIDLDKMLTDQNWESSEYSHNMQLIGYQSSKYQNAGELTNYGKMLKADIGLRKQRTNTLEEEIAALKEQAQYYRNKYGPGTAEEKEITEQIMKREEELEKENTEIEKNNKLLEENADKIRRVRKSLEDTVDKQIEDEKKRQREILSANVSLQDTIVNLLRQRLQKEWELKKKDIEKEKESLNEYKKLINERFNYRRKAADQADKEEELAEYRRQLALVEADPTRTKDAKELRRKIADMEKEQAWNLAEEELNAENERIDEQVTGMDKFVQYNEELLNEILGDANNFSAEMNTILTDSFEESYNNILEFMKKENEAFMKSLPDAQKQMIQSWEDTAKKAYDIIDTNYPQIQDILVSEESYIEYMKKYDQNYRKALEGNDTNYMEILERQYRENYQSLIRALKDDAEFEVHEHDLGEVESKEGKLDDELFDVDTKEITGEPAYTPEFDDSTVTAQDFSQYMDLVLESLDGIYKAIVPEEEVPEETSSDDKSGTSGGKKHADAIAYWRDSDGYVHSVSGKGTGDTRKEADDNALANAKKNAQSQGEYLSSNIVKRYKHGGMVDYTGLAMVDGTKQRPEAFLNANDTESIRTMLNAFNYVKTHPYMSHIDSSMYGNNTNVGDINITINQAELKSDADYDAVARKVGQAFSKQLSRQGLNLSGYAF